MFVSEIYNVDLLKTIPLKIYGYGEELDTLVQGFTTGMNYASEVLFENGKPMGSQKLQKIIYQNVRDLGLKSQMACNVCRQVSGTYKTLQDQITKTKNGDNPVEWQKITYKPTTITFSYKRDYTITKDWISITTLDKRQKYGFYMYKHAEQYFDGTWQFIASKLVKRKDGYYFHLCVSKEVPDPLITETQTFMGVDVGMNWLAVASTTDKKSAFLCGGTTKHVRNTYKNMRKRLQSKGTKSAKRVLKRMTGKEKRLMESINHKVSKDVITFAKRQNVQCIGLEDLTGLRTATQYQCKRKNRYHKSSWSYHQLQWQIEYKAKDAGILIEWINPEYTSQTCPRCNTIDKTNRHGLMYKCKCCGFSLHSDLVGARNIETRTRIIRHDLEIQGCESTSQTETVA